MKIALVVLGILVAVAAAFVRPPSVTATAPAGFATTALPDARRTALPLRTPLAVAVVYVAGEVAHAGVVRVAGDARVADALALAGGARAGADLVAVNLAAHVRDGDEIVVPARGSAAVATPRARRSTSCAPRAASPRSAHRSRAPRMVPATGPDEIVDVNRADAPTLATLPGIGPALAERIVAYRDAFGPFATIDDLLDVAGITERRLAAIAPLIAVRP